MPLYPALVTGDQSVVQVRRTTALTLSDAYANVAFDTTDIQNNTSVIEHISTTRIKVKITGKYGVSYALTAPAGTQTTSLQVRVNDVSVLPGSGRFSAAAGDAENITGYFIADLTADGYITLQAKSSVGVPDIAAGMTLSVVHLAGPKGDQGSASAVDINAVHTNAGSEISGLEEKTSPIGNDLIIIEDSATTFTKKKLKVGNLPSGAALSDVVPVNITKAAAAQGAAAEASRQDHKHDISTAAPDTNAVVVGNAADEGAATTLARSDHQHLVDTAAAVSVGTSNTAGSSGKFVHSDHLHAGLTRGAADFNSFTGKVTPVANDILLIEDSAATNAKKKITIGSLPADTTAIHKATSAEISVMTEKTTPSSADVFVIEDSDAAYAKKKLQVGNLPADSTAIHKAVAAEISALSVKATPISADLLLIEDSADGNNKKKITIGTLPADTTAIHKATASEISAITLKATPVSADLLLIEDSADTNNKKRITIGTLPAGVDTTAIHKATAAEISVITEKTAPVSADLLLIEDSADGNNKKRVQIGNLPVIREVTEFIPAPEGRTNGQGTRAAATTYEGASFIVRRASSFNRIFFRISAKPTNGNAVVGIYQATNGLSGIASLVGSATISITTTGVITSALNEGTVLLSSGLCYVLWGKTTGSFSFAVYANQTIGLLNDPSYVDVATHPVTFTTTTSTATFPATFNPLPTGGGGATTPSTSDLAVQIRMKTI